MEIGHVTTKGQVVIPSRLRKKFRIKAGTRVNFYEEDDGIKIIPITREIIEANIGFLRTGGDLLKELMEEKNKEREL